MLHFLWTILCGLLRRLAESGVLLVFVPGFVPGLAAGLTGVLAEAATMVCALAGAAIVFAGFVLIAVLESRSVARASRRAPE